MIRINLLPYREKEKKANIQSWIVFFAGSLVLFLLVLVGVHFYFSMGISRLEKSIKEENAKLVVLNKKVGDIEARKKDKQEVEAKLGVIRSLEGDRLFPVLMLDGLNLLVPARDIWLEKINQTGNELRIEGVARNNDAVARFMKSLEKAAFIQSVDLMGTKEKEVSGIKLQQFILACITKKGF
jgi:type IV pilus assembly protein PilN